MDKTQLTEHAIEPHGSHRRRVRDWRSRRDQLSRHATGGFTLVELIVALTISLIVIGIATAMLLSGTNMAQRTAQRALEEQIIDGVFKFAQDRLLYVGTIDKGEADKLSTVVSQDMGLLYVSENGTTATETGMLYFRGVSDSSVPLNVMGKDFYMSYSVSLEAKLTYTVGNKPVVFLKLKLHNKTGQVIAERERTFTLVNGAVVADGKGSETTVTNGDFLYFAASAPTSPPSTP